ncbi:MAG: prealbumin-like fold domain-containing protein [Collinsella sp.]
MRPAKADEMGQAVDTITTPRAARSPSRGLDAAGYQLVETKAPDGYNKLQKPRRCDDCRKLRSEWHAQ